MGDLRFGRFYDRLLHDPEALREFDDAELVQALAGAATSKEMDPFVVNVITTEALNRLLRGKRAEAVLQRTLSEMQGVLEAVPDALASLDLEGRLKRWNPRLEEATGRSPGELYWMEFVQLFPEGERAAVRDAMERGLAFGGARFEALFGLVGGVTAPYEWTGAPTRDVDGRVTGLALVGRDISKRRKAEAEAARLACVIESSVDAIFRYDLAGSVTDWNPAAERLYGWRAEEVVGRPFTVLFPPERATEAVRVLERVRHGEAVRGLATERVRKDGRRVAVDVTVWPVRDEKGRVIGAASVHRER